MDAIEQAKHPQPNPFDPGQGGDVFEPPIAPQHTLEAREAALARREQAWNDRVKARQEAAKLTEANVEAQIVSEHALCAWDAFGKMPNIDPVAERALRCTTVVIFILRNGFPIVGTSVAASPENYDGQTGAKEAREEALAKLWLCAEFSARSQLMGMDPIEPIPPPEQIQ